MTYELAKQLKDAGFPLGCKGCQVCLAGPAQTGKECLTTLDCVCHFPTLEELIEACGGVFLSLSFFQRVSDDLGKLEQVWDASGLIEGHTFYGSTPTEAVAQRWLALHELAV